MLTPVGAANEVEEGSVLVLSVVVSSSVEGSVGGSVGGFVGGLVTRAVVVLVVVVGVVVGTVVVVVGGNAGVVAGRERFVGSGTRITSSECSNREVKDHSLQ